MNHIESAPIETIGYNFIARKYIPADENEYYLRNIQNKNWQQYRKITQAEIEALEKNNNWSNNWNDFLVSEKFNPSLIKNNKFYGLVRIGNLEPLSKSFHGITTPVGVYDSSIISCDLGNNISIRNVDYLGHYIIDDDVIITSTKEMETTSIAKFGNGVLKEDEEEKYRIWLELCNENGGRSVLPFNNMLAADAYLWSKYRADEVLLEKFKNLTDQEFDRKRGYYGYIGKRTVIKNCGILKDVWIGSDAYLKGANKIKNITINSDAERPSQIGEGCELVNGIIGYGCRVFYGVKAVRFVLASHSQLKYGARLINSYLGNNATISCCEVLNSLIFPSHEQHHNNSFLCAALIEGQSNIAAGATIGSNHNSRGADGELQSKRGFWPGLCVSLKHNSKFASYTIIAKGHYVNELNIPIPFSLVSQQPNKQVTVMPAYWFLYNMYALQRNALKYIARDMRTEKIMHIEYDYLAPDTINEMFTGIDELQALSIDANTDKALVRHWENGKVPVLVQKINTGIETYRSIIVLYAALNLVKHFVDNQFADFAEFKNSIPQQITRSEWTNLGGQLTKNTDVSKLLADIKNNTLTTWQQVHNRYKVLGENYSFDKLVHAYTSLLEVKNITTLQFTQSFFEAILQESIAIQSKLVQNIYESRKKDYENPYRKMVYNNKAEMESVLGSLDKNDFIQSQFEALEKYKSTVEEIITVLNK